MGKMVDEVANIIKEPEVVGEIDEGYKAFLQQAGEDGELDANELKTMLNKMMKSELQQQGGVQKSNANGLNATPTPQGGDGDNNLITALLSLVCGAVCKDTPLAELIPAPSSSNPVSAFFSDFGFNGFSIEMCRSIVAMLDADRSGKLGYPEFKNLMLLLQQLRKAWKMYDTDNSGTMNGFEAQKSFSAAGYTLNKRILAVLMHRYGTKNGEVSFEDFLLCSIKVKTMMDVFKKKETDGVGKFTMEDWLENTLYC